MLGDGFCAGVRDGANALVNVGACSLGLGARRPAFPVRGFHGGIRYVFRSAANAAIMIFEITDQTAFGLQLVHQEVSKSRSNRPVADDTIVDCPAIRAPYLNR
jgi:hypothetical protein